MAKTKFADESDITMPDDDLHLIYKIEGRQNEVDIFELARVLGALGEVLKEGNRVLNPDTELALKVQPFQPGSFIMDIALEVQQNPALLAFLAHPDFLKQAESLLEYLGLIRKAGDLGVSLLELLRRLKTGKPEKISQRGDRYDYTAVDGGTISVTSTVHNLYNNGVINNYFYSALSLAGNAEVDQIRTSLKGAESTTSVQISKADVSAVQAFVQPDSLDREAEVLENNTVYMLHPKSGTYGAGKGQYTFTIAGTSRILKAKITDQKFLADYASGTIRFYAQDLLKARVHEKQIVEGSKVKAQNEIIEVLEYRSAHPSERR